MKKPTFKVEVDTALEWLKSLKPCKNGHIITCPPDERLKQTFEWDRIPRMFSILEESKRIIMPTGNILVQVCMRKADLPGEVFNFVNEERLKVTDYYWNRMRCGNPYLSNRFPLPMLEPFLVIYANRLRYNDLREPRKGPTAEQSARAHQKRVGETISLARLGLTLTRGETDLKTRHMGNLFEYDSMNTGEPMFGHPTRLPSKVAEQLVLTFTNQGDTIIDPFCGVGSIGVAALKHGRSFIGCDIVQEYIDTAERRLTVALKGGKIVDEVSYERSKLRPATGMGRQKPHPGNRGNATVV